MTTALNGFTTPQFDSVRDAFQAQMDSGLDVGASVAIFHHGELVADLWGGTRDEAGEVPWTEDTLVNVWSTTKTMTFLVALMLADRGELDFEAPVAKYWPEFAQNGKEGVAVKHLMSHTSGLSGWTNRMVGSELADWNLTVGRLAEQAPWW